MTPNPAPDAAGSDIPITVCRYLPDTTFTYVNDAHCRHFGQTREQLLGKPFLPYLPPDEARDFLARIARLTPDNPVCTGEYKTTGRHGEVFWMRWTESALRFENGRAVEFQSVGIDITHQKSADAAHAAALIEELRRRQSAIVNSIPDFAWMKDAAGRFIMVNEPLARAAGRPIAEIVGKTDFDVWPRDLAEHYRKDDEEIMRSRASRKIEEQVMGPDGRRLWVESWKSAFKNEGGEVVGTVGIARDMTERHQMEEALRASEERFASLVRSVPGIIYRCRLDAAFTVVFISDAVESITGYPAADFLDGRVDIMALIHPDDRQSVAALVRDRVSRGEPYEVEYRLRHRNGSWRSLHGIGRAVLSPLENGETFLDGFVLDVTGQRQSKEKLRESELKFKTLFENASEAIFLIDGESGVILDCNARSGVLLKRRKGELVGKHHTVLHLPEDAERQSSLLELSANAHFDKLISDVVQSDGNRVPVWITARTVEIGGRSMVVKMVVDMTTFKGAEEELRRGREAVFHSQKMEALGMLAGGVAHDFNNLLAAILGFTDVVLSATPKDDPRHADLLEVRMAANSAADITRRLLTFGRKQVVQMSGLSVNDVVTELKPLLKRSVGEEVSVVYELAPQPTTILGDRVQLEQIMLNLSVNAREAMPHGGTLTIRTSVRTLSGALRVGRETVAAGRYVELSVQDTGSGIAKEIAERIFDPFFTTKAKGSGLGLSIVYSAVKQAGGYVAAESELGKGTCMRMFLPLNDGGAPAAVEEARAPARGKARILLVEDEAAVRRVAERMLSSHGYRVTAADGPKEALRLADGETFDMLITDVVMPGMTGRELAQELVQRRPDLKVLYMSGYPGDVLGERGVIAGQTNFIPKPFSVKSFLEKVESVLSAD